MSEWPDSLPYRPLVADYAEKRQDGAIRSDMDSGPAKVRRRFTVVVETFAIGLSLSSDQYDTLLDFFSLTLEEGTLAFDWIHPRTEEPKSCRFVGPPTLKAQTPARFKISFQMEILP